MPGAPLLALSEKWEKTLNLSMPKNACTSTLPSPTLVEVPERTMRRVSILGVIVGGIVDVVTSNIVAIPIVIYVMAKNDLLHLPPHERQTALLAALHHGPALYITQVALGTLCSLLGGYIAALIARHDQPLNGALSSWLCIAMGIFTIFFSKTHVRSAEDIVLILLSPAVAYAGGYLRQAQARRRTSVAIA